MKNFLSVLFALNCGIGFAQIQTLNTQPDESSSTDVTISSLLGAINNDYIGAWSSAGGITQNSRGYVKFSELSNIPDHAVILSAELKIYRNEISKNASEDVSCYIRRVTSSWSESSTSNPSVTSVNQVSIPNESASTTETLESYEVKNLVEYMVANPAQNYGFRIYFKNGIGGSHSRGRSYYSSAYSVASKRPQLIVKYYLPLPEISGDVTHCDFGQENGAIDVSVSGGSGSYTDYDWYDGQTESYFATTEDVSGLGPGWYGLKVEDDEGTVGTQIFVVGEECSNTTISINPPEEFAKDLHIIHGDEADLYSSFYTNSYFRTGTIDFPGLFGNPDPPAVYYNGIWGFDVDGLWDGMGNPLFTFKAVNVQLTQGLKTVHSSAELYGKLITQSWEEENTCYANAPSYSSNTSEWEYYDFINYSGVYQANVDVKSYFEDDGEVSFYNFIDLNGGGYSTNQSFYWDVNSSSYTNDIDQRPILTLNIDQSCQTVKLKHEDELDGQFYDVNLGGYLIFEYDEEYNVSEMIFEIYEASSGDVVKNQDDLPYNPISIGDNRVAFNFSAPNSISEGYYILKVTDPKAEVKKLRFHIH